MAVSVVNAFFEWAHGVLPDRFSCWHSTGSGSILCKEIFTFFSRVFDEITPFFSSTQAKTHLQFHDMTQ